MKKIICLLLIIVVLDQITGFALNKLYQRTFYDEKGGLINFALKQQPDILIVGSSRAKHHVSPDILQTSLSATVFNAGINGQDFLYAVMLLDLWKHFKSPPKLILFHIDEGSLKRNEIEIQRTNVFSGYYNRNEVVRSIIVLKSKFERTKYYSATYRFNGKIFHILKGLIIKQDPSFRGYEGLTGTIDKKLIPNNKNSITNSESTDFWDLKLKYFYELIDYCETNNVRLVFFHSPRFLEDNEKVAVWSKKISNLLINQKNAVFLDPSQLNIQFKERPDLFKDSSHLNSKGAEIYSRIIADELAKHFNRN